MLDSEFPVLIFCSQILIYNFTFQGLAVSCDGVSVFQQTEQPLSLRMSPSTWQWALVEGECLFGQRVEHGGIQWEGPKVQERVG